MLGGVEDCLHDEVVVGMRHVRNEDFVVVLSAAESLDVAGVALVEEYGYVGNDLIDGLFGEEVGLPGLHLHDGAFLLGGKDHGVFGEDVQRFLHIGKFLELCRFSI